MDAAGGRLGARSEDGARWQALSVGQPGGARLRADLDEAVSRAAGVLAGKGTGGENVQKGKTKDVKEVEGLESE